MQWLIDFPDTIEIPLADWIDAFEDWLVANFAGFFEAVRDFLLFFLIRIEDALLWLPWAAVFGVVVLLAWRARGSRLAVGSAVGMLLIGALGLWDLTMQTIAVVVVAALLAIAVGIPLGIAMARSERMAAAMRPILDTMQTMPSFVYLVPVVVLFSIGTVPALIATWVYAVPPVVRLTNLGIRQVPIETIEAAEAFGSTPWQLLWKVQLPLAFPTIMAGVNQTVMMALAMVVVASLVGADGLGLEVLRGIGQLNTGQAVVGGLGIVILAIIIDRLSQAVGRTREEGASA